MSINSFSILFFMKIMVTCQIFWFTLTTDHHTYGNNELFSDLDTSYIYFYLGYLRRNDIKTDNPAREYHVAMYSKCLLGIWSIDNVCPDKKLTDLVSGIGFDITLRNLVAGSAGLMPNAFLRIAQSFQRIWSVVFFRAKSGRLSSESSTTIIVEFINGIGSLIFCALRFPRFNTTTSLNK